MKKNNKGFTLAELLIVVAVIAVLVAVAIPTFANQLEKSRQAVDVANLRGAYAAAKLAIMDITYNSSDGKYYIDCADEYDATTGKATMKTGTDGEEVKADSGVTLYYDPDTGTLCNAIADIAKSSDYTSLKYKNAGYIRGTANQKIVADWSGIDALKTEAAGASSVTQPLVAINYKYASLAQTPAAATLFPSTETTIDSSLTTGVIQVVIIPSYDSTTTTTDWSKFNVSIGFTAVT